MRYAGLFLVLFLLCTACARHVISGESLRLVDESLDFPMLKKNPDQFVGHYVLLGGAIASLSNSQQGARLEVVQFGLASDEMPDSMSSSGGRFLARTSDFLDPVIFRANRLVTLVGKVTGHETGQLDSMTYDYPVVAIREIYYWRLPDVLFNPYPPDYYPELDFYPYHPFYPYSLYDPNYPFYPYYYYRFWGFPYGYQRR